MKIISLPFINSDITFRNREYPFPDPLALANYEIVIFIKQPTECISA